MKHLIAITSLLAAGTALANADIVNFNLTRADTTVLFEELVASDIIELSYIDWTTDTSGKKNLGAFQTPANSAYQNTFSPDAQLVASTTGSWTMNFSIKNTGTEAITLNSFTFNVYEINGGGSDKDDTTSVAASMDGCDSVRAYGGYRGTTVAMQLIFNEALKLDAGASKTLAFSLGSVTQSAKSEKFNTYAGITGGSVDFSVIPEPSAFGLLAGAGALALVAARRRRRAK